MYGDVEITVQDGGLGLTSSGTGVHVKIGASPAAAEQVIIRGSMTAARIKELLGLSPLADSAMLSVANGADRIICLPVAPSTAGTVGPVTKGTASTGGGTLTAAGSPNHSYTATVEIRRSGGLNSAVFRLSLNGGISWSDELTVPLAGSYEVPGAGVTLTFTAGDPPADSFKLGDSWSFSTTAPQLTNEDVLAAIGRAAGIAEEFELVHIVGEASPALWAAVSTEQQTIAASKKRALLFVLEAPAKTEAETVAAYVQTLTAAAAAVNNYQLQVVAARGVYQLMDGNQKELNLAALFCGFYARAAVQQSIGATMHFAIAKDKLLALRPAGIEDYLEDLDSARLAAVRQYAGLEGYYVTSARVLAPANSDYQYAEDVRVSNKIRREVRKKALLQLQADVDMSDLQGDLDTKAKFCGEPLDQMVADKEISAYAITAPEGQDILTTKTLQLQIRYVPIGKVRAIAIDLACTAAL
ncbi:MAG: DUF2586 family protein [Peptococcaceae bacterium]|nr:DUF2586 family protein [Peptococcaceae bacterium]